MSACVLFVTDKGLGSWSSAFQRSPFAFLLGDVKALSKMTFLAHSSWLYSYTVHGFVLTASERCGTRNNNSFKEGSGDTALKTFSFQSFPGMHVWGKIFHAQSNKESCIGVCFQLSIRNGHEFHICLTDAQLGQLCSNSEQAHLQFEVTGSVMDFLDLVLAFLVTTEGRSLSKHSQAFYKESQSKKLFLDLIF